MKEVHQLRKILFRKIIGPHPRIEFRQPEVDRIRSIRHRRTRTIPISRRSQ
jgi:hypothetical protein